jgi:hypothetical protein
MVKTKKCSMCENIVTYKETTMPSGKIKCELGCPICGNYMIWMEDGPITENTSASPMPAPKTKKGRKPKGE